MRFEVFTFAPLASPVDALERAATGEALVVMATIDAVDVSPVAVSAEVKEAPASVDDALDLSEIVHWRVPAGNSATARNSCDNAHVERVHSRRPGSSEVVTPGPTFLVGLPRSSAPPVSGANYAVSSAGSDSRASRCPLTPKRRHSFIDYESPIEFELKRHIAAMAA